MKHEQAFLHHKGPELPKTPKEQELYEMRQDLSLFRRIVQDAITKITQGFHLSGKEQSEFEKARNRWWEDKYGFPYSQTSARQEVLARKYQDAPELAKAKQLQTELFAACQKKDQKKLAELKQQYETTFPSQLEGVTVIFELISHLQLQKQHDQTEHHTFKRQDFERMTQFQFLITDFVQHNSGDKDFLRLFWDTAETLARQSGTIQELHRLRRGVLSQVATYKVFDALELHPKISHPKEDAFESIDLWAEGNEAIQIKGTSTRETLLAETDEIGFPGVEVQTASGIQHFTTDLMAKAQRFRAKIDRYQRVIGKPIHGYFVVIPYSKFDFVTGEPDKTLINEIRGLLAARKAKREQAH